MRLINTVKRFTQRVEVDGFSIPGWVNFFFSPFENNKRSSLQNWYSQNFLRLFLGAGCLTLKGYLKRPVHIISNTLHPKYWFWEVRKKFCEYGLCLLFLWDTQFLYDFKFHIALIHNIENSKILRRLSVPCL